MTVPFARAGLGAISAALIASGSTVAFAQSGNDFYKGKTITLVISAGPGGGSMRAMIRWRIPTMAVSCTSSRFLSSFSN